MEPQVVSANSTFIELEAQKPVPEQVPEEARQAWVNTYLAACKEYQVTPSSDVVTCFKLGLDTLKLHQFRNAAPFMELDLQPIMQTFDRYPEALERLKTMNFLNAKLGPSGTVVVAEWLSRENCSVETLHFARQLPGAVGLEALLGAVRRNKNLRNLHMPGCFLGDKGSAMIASLLEEGQKVHGLSLLDLENNGIPFDNLQRFAAIEEMPTTVNLEGNQVFDETLNAVSHGIGVILATVGTVYMGMAVWGKGTQFAVAVVIYSICLHALYIASCLFHAFLSLGQTVRAIFGILDHSAIYLLIAGSYCPFVLIHLPHAHWILYVLLVASVFGVATSAFYHGPGKVAIELTLYLGMGWSCVIYISDLQLALGPDGLFLLGLGGVLYTLGVPFFVRQKRICGIPDHTTWHFFVLAASVVHFFCIYWYCFACAQGKLSSQTSCECLQLQDTPFCVPGVPPSDHSNGLFE